MPAQELLVGHQVHAVTLVGTGTQACMSAQTHADRQQTAPVGVLQPAQQLLVGHQGNAVALAGTGTEACICAQALADRQQAAPVGVLQPAQQLLVGHQVHAVARGAHADQPDSLQHAAHTQASAPVHKVQHLARLLLLLLLLLLGLLVAALGPLGVGGLPDLVAHEAGHQDAQLLQGALPASNTRTV